MAAGPKAKRDIFRSEDLEAQERELVDRLLASAAGLPRLCAFKRCRRRKRCFGQTIECLRLHTGLARARFESALKKLGWRRPARRQRRSGVGKPPPAACTAPRGRKARPAMRGGG